MNNNEETRETLAKTIVDGWEIKTMEAELIRRIIEDYEHDNDVFQENWKDVFGVNYCQYLLFE